MNIWQPYDFFFAAGWAAFAVGIRFASGWLDKNVKNDSEMSTREAKTHKYLLIVIRALGWLTVAFSVGTLALPLLDVLLTTLLGKASALFSKYGGLALLAGAGVALWKQAHPKSPIVDAGAVDPVEVEYAAQEAKEVHEDMGELIFNATVDTSENTPLTRPRDALSIETGREKPYYMDGIMAVHQFSVDVSAPLNRANEDLVIQELQRHTDQRGKRYPALLRDGHTPIILDVKNSGNFITVEAVLYSDKYKDRIEARRKARIARQQSQGDIYDPDC